MWRGNGSTEFMLWERNTRENGGIQQTLYSRWKKKAALTIDNFEYCVKHVLQEATSEGRPFGEIGCGWEAKYHGEKVEEHGTVVRGIELL